MYNNIIYNILKLPFNKQFKILIHFILQKSKYLLNVLFSHLY